MSSDKTLNKLIIAVKSRPCIYDPTHCMHKNKKVINKCWNEIADELNEKKQKIGKLKRRWNGLRSSYVKYRKANDSTRESTYYNQYKEYNFGPQLEFLEPHFQHINEEEDSDDSNSNIPNEVPHEPVIDIPITESDDIKYLFLSYAKTLRKLSPRVKISLKFELAKLFLKAEWEHIIQERDYSIPLKMETHFSDDE